MKWAALASLLLSNQVLAAPPPRKVKPAAPPAQPETEEAPTPKTPPYRRLENLSIGLRDTYHGSYTLSPPIAFSWVEVCPDNPNLAYLITDSGIIYRTSNAGRLWTETRLIPNQSLYFGAFRKEGARLGVGIRGQAKRLQAQIRAYWAGQAKPWQEYMYAYPYAMRNTQVRVVKSPMHITPGSINLKQFLVMRSGPASRIPMRINHVAFTPGNNKLVYVATAYGVFQTRDGGLSWHSSFFGATPMERNVVWIAVDPKNTRRVLLGTMGGLFMSTNAGTTWTKDFRTPLGTLKVLKIAFFAKDPRVVYAGTDEGLWKSLDGGTNWRWVYGLKESGIRETFVIERIAVSNQNADLVYIGTQDGVRKTTDGGKSWKTVNDGVFAMQQVRGLRISPKDDNHVFIAVEHNLYETRDGGKNWRIAYVPVGQWWINNIVLDPTNPELLWVLSDRMVYRLVPGLPKRPVSRDALRMRVKRRQKRYPPLPPFGSILNRAFRHNGVHQAQLKKKRKKALLRNLLPKLHVSYAYSPYGFFRNLRFAKWTNTALDPWEFGRFRSRKHVFTVMFTWDLMKLFYDPDVLQYGRIAFQARRIRRQMRVKLLWLFDEAARLRATMIVNPPQDLGLSLIYENRLKEINNLLNISTGNYVARWQQEWSERR